MRLYSVILFMSVASLLIGCGKSKNHESDNRIILESYRLIDEGRTEEAITLLEDKLLDKPGDYKYTTILASAYAHKAGIKIQKLIPVIRQAEKIKKQKKLSAKIKKNKPLNETVNNIALNISNLLEKISNFFSTYASIPLINSTGAIYIKHAITLLEEVEKKHPIKSEDALYRAVLRIILFKHIVAEKLIGEFAQSPSTSKDKCTFNLGSVNGSLIELGRLLVDTFTDVGIANKKQAKNMRASSENVANTISNLTLATTSLIVIDETSNLFLKQTVIQHSFGKLIKCGGD